MLSHIRDGFRYAFGFPPIRDVLVLLAFISLVGIPYSVLFPVFARDVLGGDARTLGLLTSSAGAGALIGALFLASRSTIRGLGRLIAGSAALFGVCLIGFGLSRHLVLSCAFLAAGGFGIMLTRASVNTVLQMLVGEDMRGRVMSLYTMAFMGMTPIGSLTGGALANRFGAPLVVAAGGLGCVVLSAWFARRVAPLRELVLPVYERLGIIPEVASALQSASDLRSRG